MKSFRPQLAEIFNSTQMTPKQKAEGDENFDEENRSESAKTNNFPNPARAVSERMRSH